jgi:hypothetical protein
MAASYERSESSSAERPNPPEVVAALRDQALDFARMRERVIVELFSERGREGSHSVLGNVRQVSLNSLSLSLLREHGGGKHSVPLMWVRAIRKAPPRKWVPL